MTNGIDVLEQIPLSTIIIINALNAGLKLPAVAKMCKCSNAAVYDYYHRHKTEIKICLEKSDSILALQFKVNAAKAAGKLEQCLEEPMSKKDMAALNIISAVQAEKYRLLSDQSTENISYGNISSECEKIVIELAKRGIKVGDTINITPDYTPDNADSLPLAKAED